MAIKPLDIRRKEFKNSLRGYEHNGVDDFLDTVADEFEKIFSENQRMKDQVSTLRERLEQFDDLEGSIRAALVHAEQAASDLRKSAARDAEDVRQAAQREAELTIREAKAQSHQMLAESSGRVERVRESYEALQEARGTFAADFRHLLQTYMSVMDNMDVATAKQIEATLRERLDPESIAIAREAAANETASAQDTLIQTPEPTTTDTSPTDTSAPDDTAESTADEAPAFETSPESTPGDEPRSDESRSEEYDREQDPDATQRIVPGTADYPAGGSEPEVDEPEVEPSSTPQEETVQETSPSETAEPEREEPAAFDASGETSGDKETSEDDTQDRTLASDSSSEGFFEERQQSNERTSRAGRFLRRRG